MGLPLAARGIIFIVAHGATNSLAVMMMVIFEGFFCNRVKVNELSDSGTFHLTGENSLACANKVHIIQAVYFVCLRRQIKRTNRERWEDRTYLAIQRWDRDGSGRRVRTDGVRCQSSWKVMIYGLKLRVTISLPDHLACIIYSTKDDPQFAAVSLFDFVALLPQKYV